MRRAVRIVFETLDDAGYPVLVALEIDQTVALLVSAADVAGGLPARMVARAGAVLLVVNDSSGPPLVQVRAVDFDDEARSRGGRLHFNECHGR